MKILVAPSAYKGTLSAAALSCAIAYGIRRVLPDAEILAVPIADGGDGTVEALHASCGGEVEHLPVEGPLGGLATAKWLRLSNLAVVELASASGIAYLNDQSFKPLSAHTKGLGQVLKHCLEEGEFSEIYVAVGGSASTDGGTGALTALGAKFLDERGNELPLGGGALVRLHSCDLSALDVLFGFGCAIKVAVDVQNPLLGRQGAARVFAAQKGGNGDDIEILEAGLTRLANVMEEGKEQKLRSAPGTGAAGGTAFGLALGLNAEIISGFQFICGLLELEEKVQVSDFVITAEGRLDQQSLHGKATGELARLCRQFKRPLIVMPAQSAENIDLAESGITRVMNLSKHGCQVTVETVMEGASVLAQMLMSESGL